MSVLPECNTGRAESQHCPKLDTQGSDLCECVARNGASEPWEPGEPSPPCLENQCQRAAGRVAGWCLTGWEPGLVLRNSWLQRFACGVNPRVYLS